MLTSDDNNIDIGTARKIVVVNGVVKHYIEIDGQWVEDKVQQDADDHIHKED